MTQEEINKLMQSKEEINVILYSGASSVGLEYNFNEFVNLIDKLTEENKKKLKVILYTNSSSDGLCCTFNEIVNLIKK